MDSQSKSYPENYSSDATKVLDAMSFTNGKAVELLGSMSLRSQQYAGDYDAFEIVNMAEDSDKIALHMLAVRWKEIIKELSRMKNTYIGDIKSGAIEEWRIIPKEARVVDNKVEGLNVVASKKRLQQLKEHRIISENEAKRGMKMLSGKMTPIRFLEAKAELKFHTVRWKVPEILEGHKILRDGRSYTIEDGFSSPSITKLDVISLVQNSRFTDFSMVYYFRNNNKLLNPDLIDIANSLKENMIYYKSVGNYFKALNRQFALAKFERNASVIQRLTPILNSDLGRLYHIISDIGTLTTLLEDYNPNQKLVRFEIDQFINRLSNVYQLKDYLKEEHTILGLINAALKEPSKEVMITKLNAIKGRLERVLNNYTKKILNIK